MRRYLVLALAVLTLLGLLSPPALAQAPAPKVTINGLLDFVTQWDKNLQDGDTTNRETEWWSRQRGRFDFKGEVGKGNVVWGVEMDFANGNTPRAHGGTSAGFDLDTDVAGVIETKWLYLEFPLTGPGSILPFIQVPTIARGGGQPFRNHDFKLGMLASVGDFGGLNLVTTFSPEIRNIFTFAQIEELNSGREGGFTSNRDSWAIIDSLEVTPWKGFTVKPTVSYAEFGGNNQGSASLGTTPRGGFNVGADRLWRATVGGDLEWKSGPWLLEPTFHYQFGEQRLPVATRAATGETEADIRAWIVDIIGGWRSGPLNLQARFTYTSGNDADECVQTIAGVCRGGSDINYYEPINPGFGYYALWTEIWTGVFEYLNAGPSGASRGRERSIGFDKYGLIAGGVKATYSLTPAFSLFGIVQPSWTAEKVDTNGAVTANGITPADAKGDDRYLGTEIDVGINWSFAPRTTLGVVYGHLFAGEALNQCIPASASCARPRDAKDIDTVAARVRFTF
ncbi:MAG: porin [Candidatus Rokubacteria bacterium]|nr:porin [Candidatus Rokubacteria bacterium]